MTVPVPTDSILLRISTLQVGHIDVNMKTPLGQEHQNFQFITLSALNWQLLPKIKCVIKARLNNQLILLTIKSLYRADHEELVIAPVYKLTSC